MGKHRAGQKKRARIQFNIERKRLQGQFALAEIKSQLEGSTPSIKEPKEKPKIISQFEGYFTTEGYIEHLKKQGKLKPLLKYHALPRIDEEIDQSDAETIVNDQAANLFDIEITTEIDFVDLVSDSEN